MQADTQNQVQNQAKALYTCIPAAITGVITASFAGCDLCWDSSFCLFLDPINPLVPLQIKNDPPTKTAKGQRRDHFFEITGQCKAEVMRRLHPVKVDLGCVNDERKPGYIYSVARNQLDPQATRKDQATAIGSIESGMRCLKGADKSRSLDGFHIALEHYMQSERFPFLVCSAVLVLKPRKGQ